MRPAWHPYRRQTDWFWLARRSGRAVRWAARAPADRMTLPAAVLVYGGGEMLHLTGAAAPMVAVIGAVAAPALTYGVVKHRSHGHGHDSDEAAWRGGRAALGVIAAGAWCSAAAAWGVTAGPDGLMSLAWAGIAGLGYAFVRADEVTRRNRDWRGEKARWHRESIAYGLQGSHLLSSQPTRLGRMLEVDVRGTGRRASSVAARDTAERIAEHKQLPPGRVQIRPGRIAGRVTISVRERDPWAQPIPHPVLDAAPEIALPDRQSVTGPLIAGQDPETGRPLEVTVYDEDGAAGLLVVAQTGAGKSVLLSCLKERLTACDDALIWQINLSKAKEDRRWAQACDLSACGPRERRKALDILRLAVKVIEYRGATGEDAVHVPTPRDPAIVLIIDEMDALQGGSDALSLAAKALLNTINSKKRSEGVVLIEAGQRGVITHAGSADIRANFTAFAIARVRSRSEMGHVAGELGFELPDMTVYGEGHAGVWLLGAPGGDFTTGRAFRLRDLDDITAIARARPPRATLPPGLLEYLGDAYVRARTGRAVARAAAGESRPQWMKDLDSELSKGDEVSDLIGQLGQLDALAERNRLTRAELDALADSPLAEPGPELAEAMRASRAERHRQAAAAVVIPDAHRQAILDALASGVSSGELMERLGLARMTVWRYLHALRVEGVAEMRGKGRGARWHLRGQEAA